LPNFTVAQFSGSPIFRCRFFRCLFLVALFTVDVFAVNQQRTLILSECLSVFTI